MLLSRRIANAPHVAALGLAWLCGFAQAASAQAKPRVPEPLAPWVQWVLDGAPELGCPATEDGPLCEWPGQLRLELNARGGRFEQAAWVDRVLYLKLPGGPGRWPLEVRVDGKP